MDDARPATQTTNEPVEPQQNSRRMLLIKWGVVAACAFSVAFIPVPDGITPQAWRLLAIFFATIVGSIIRPISGSADSLAGRDGGGADGCVAR